MATYDVGNVLVKIETRANSTIKTIDKLILKMEKLNSALALVNQTNLKIDKANIRLRQTTKEIGNIDKKSKSASKSFSSLFNLGKIYFLFNYFKRIGTAIGNMASNAVNFNETLNKFQVSTKGYYEDALGFVNSLTKAFNLSTESVMNYQATFKNMLSALGQISEETSYYLSESLTAMAIDYASLFNVSIETAMSQFESALSGQVRSIRSTSGYDITERTLYSVYQQIGGTKTMRQLTQTEKRLLIILALQKQIEETGAKGDFGKTIENTANQLKQIQETLKEVSRWLGQLMMTWLAPLIEKVLAGTVALREMLQTLNIMVGYTMPDFRTEEQKIKEGLDGATDSANDLEEALQEAKSVMLGFDKLNVLGGSSTSEIGTDVDMISQAIEKYSAYTNFVGNKANEIAKDILTWAGFTYNAQTQLWEFNHTLETTEEKVEYIATKFGEVIVIAIKKFIQETPKLIPLIEGFVQGIVEFINKEISSIGENLGGIFNVLNDFLVSGTNTFYNGISSIINTLISKLVVGVVSSLPQILTNLNNSLTDPTTGIIGLVINILDSVFESLPTILGGLIGGVPNMIGAILVDVFSSPLPIIKAIVDIIGSIIKNIAVIIPNFIRGVIGAFTGDNTIISSEASKVTQFGEEISNSISGYIDEIKDAWSNMFGDDDKSGVKNARGKLGNSFKHIWESIAETFKETWISVKDWFNDKIVKPIGNFFINMINGVIGGFESMINFFIRGINKITQGLSKAWEWLGIDPIAKISEISMKKIPALANGGVVTKPTMAMVGEYNGASSNPEIVSPENKMREVFVDSMLPLIQAVVSGDQQVISAINGLANRPIEMNGRKVSEAIYNDLQSVATRKGQTIFSRN